MNRFTYLTTAQGAAPTCSARVSARPSGYVFGRQGDWCEPGAHDPDRVWLWRERALRAAARRPCLRASQRAIERLGLNYPEPACVLFGSRAAITGRCVP